MIGWYLPSSFPISSQLQPASLTRPGPPLTLTFTLPPWSADVTLTQNFGFFFTHCTHAVNVSICNILQIPSFSLQTLCNSLYLQYIYITYFYCEFLFCIYDCLIFAHLFFFLLSILTIAHQIARTNSLYVKTYLKINLLYQHFLYSFKIKSSLAFLSTESPHLSTWL